MGQVLQFKKTEEQQDKSATTYKTIRRYTAQAIFYQLIGCLIIPIFPIGTVIGVILFLSGYSLTQGRECNNCGREVYPEYTHCKACGLQIIGGE